MQFEGDQVCCMTSWIGSRSTSSRVGRVLVDVTTELSRSCGLVRIVRVVVGAPNAVAQGGCAAAGCEKSRPGVENGVADAIS